MLRSPPTTMSVRVIGAIQTSVESMSFCWAYWCPYSHECKPTRKFCYLMDWKCLLPGIAISFAHSWEEDPHTAKHSITSSAPHCMLELKYEPIGLRILGTTYSVYSYIKRHLKRICTGRHHLLYNRLHCTTVSVRVLSFCYIVTDMLCAWVF